MARIRSIRPEFWDDEEIALLTRDARLLFIACKNMADDEGLLRWTAPYLKANAFMYDDDITVKDVERLMGEIAGGGFVFPYKGGKAQQSLGWIIGFPHEQKPNRPQPSKLPPPSLQNPKVRQAYGERDGWVCGICGEEIVRVQTGDAYGNGRSIENWGLSVDHVKPRVKGGSDYPTNLRAVHHTCNKTKGGAWNEAGDDSESHSPLDSLNDSVNGARDPREPDTAVVGGEGRGEVGEGLSSSATPEAGAPPEPVDDDDGRSAEPPERVAAVAEIVGRRDHEQALADGIEVPRPDAHLRKCIRNRQRDVALQRLVLLHAGRSDQEIADLVLPWHAGSGPPGRHLASVPRSPLEPDPNCPYCEGTGVAVEDGRGEVGCECRYRSAS